MKILHAMQDAIMFAVLAAVVIYGRLRGMSEGDE